MILNFSDGTSEQVRGLGTVELNGRAYRVFLSESTGAVYIYRVHMKKTGYVLVQIKDKKEFSKICGKLNSMIVY
jgi:hypothetical protein